MISNAAGQVVERLYYDPWGARRGAPGWDEPELAKGQHVLDRGFTQHEHLDALGLIHMNGRVYDPMLGRFVMAAR